jgi:hypothetical protein
VVAGVSGGGLSNFTQTPPVAVEAADVHAFRITSGTRTGPHFISFITFSTKTEELLIQNATVDAQPNRYFAYSYMLFPFSGSHDQTIRVALFRPGYETIIIHERGFWAGLMNHSLEQVVWKPETSLEKQEVSLEMLVGRESQIVRQSCIAAWPRAGSYTASPRRRRSEPNCASGRPNVTNTPGKKRPRKNHRILDSRNRPFLTDEEWLYTASK